MADVQENADSDLADERASHVPARTTPRHRQTASTDSSSIRVSFARSPHSAMRSRRPSSARPSRRCSRAATSSPRRRPGPARRPPLRCRRSSGSRSAQHAMAPPRPSSSFPRASSRCRSPRPSQSTAGSSVPACCRSTAGSRSASSCAGSDAASTSSSRLPGEPSTIRTRQPEPGPRRSGRPRRGRRDARHGFRRGPRDHPRGDSHHTPDGALLGHDLPDDRPDREAAPERPGAGQGPRRRDARRRCRRVRQVAYVVRRTDKLARSCRILDVEDPTSALIFGRHARGGGRPRGGPQRSGPRREAPCTAVSARRHATG